MSQKQTTQQIDPTILASPNFRESLGDGLIRRWSTAADTEKIGLLLSTVHRDSADEPLNVCSQDLARIFASESFPYMDAGDWAVVEDSSQPGQPIVACTALWRHRWHYVDISFAIGRPEYVATAPDYRNRGLVRGVFEMIHARSESEGHLLQAITGISYFYRQFGYEYVLDLEGSRTVYFSQITALKAGESEAYQLRPATVEDIPQLRNLYDQQRGSSLLWHELDEPYWRFIVGYWQEPRDAVTVGIKIRFLMIVDSAGEVVGSVAVRVRRWGSALNVAPAISNAAGIDRVGLMASILRLLRQQGEQTPGLKATTPSCSGLRLFRGIDRPIYELLGEKVALRVERPYAWYVRIPDLPAFLRLIAPVLEERLARSLLAGYSGELKIDLYRGGVQLSFAQGKLTQVAPWKAALYGEEATAGSPPLLFLQLLLSYRSLDELRAFYPDVWASQTSKLLIDTLFPKVPSNVLEPLS